MYEQHVVAQLVAKYPEIFRGQLPMIPSDVPDGWFEIVDRLCRDITGVLLRNPGHHLRVLQMKEKFASLRMYYALDDAEDLFADLQLPDGRIQIVTKAEGPALMDEIRALVDEASRQSTQTCQVCGRPGSERRRRGWLVTLCDGHFGTAEPGTGPAM